MLTKYGMLVTVSACPVCFLVKPSKIEAPGFILAARGTFVGRLLRLCAAFITEACDIAWYVCSSNTSLLPARGVARFAVAVALYSGFAKEVLGVVAKVITRYTAATGLSFDG